MADDAPWLRPRALTLQPNNSDFVEVDDGTMSFVKANRSGGQPLDNSRISAYQPPGQSSLPAVRVWADSPEAQPPAKPPEADTPSVATAARVQAPVQLIKGDPVRRILVVNPTSQLLPICLIVSFLQSEKVRNHLSAVFRLESLELRFQHANVHGQSITRARAPRQGKNPGELRELRS